MVVHYTLVCSYPLHGRQGSQSEATCVALSISNAVLVRLLCYPRSFTSPRYNHLKDTIARVEGELKRLHDPLLLNLPTVPISSPKPEEEEN